MAMSELAYFFGVWEQETQNTIKLLKALPASQYDFRPDASGRSLGELAWHLAEGDAYMSFGIDKGEFDMSGRPPNITRPMKVEELAPAFEVVHRDAVERLKKLTDADLDRQVPFFGMTFSIRDVLWNMIIVHGAHHRGQLSLMCRLAGGQTPGLYGPNREDVAAMGKG
jgi:uncharacterized damage-inducible protein DinB